MAKKVILKDNDNIEILPITRGELITDSSGNPAFHSILFLATDSLPGLMSAEDKAKLDDLEEVTVEDKKVELVNTTTNDSYRLLFSSTADDTTRTEGARKSANLLFNPSTGALTAPIFNGKLDWSNINNKPDAFTPEQHTHTTNEIVGLLGYTKAEAPEDLIITDTLNVALGKLEYKADTVYTWYRSVTDEDTDVYINKWLEIVDFLNNVLSGTNILDEFVTRKTPQEIIGAKTFTLPITSSVTLGTAPFIITSPTLVTNLNSDLWDGKHLYKSFDDSENIDSSALLWGSNGVSTGLASMLYAMVLNVNASDKYGRRWQIWNSRYNHQLYWRPELPDMSGYAPEHILLDSLNYKGFIELMYWANIPILSISDSNTSPIFLNAATTGMLQTNLIRDLAGNWLLDLDPETANLNIGTSAKNHYIALLTTTADNEVFINDLGNTGIGTKTPAAKLHVVGTTYINKRLSIGTLLNPYNNSRASIDLITSGAYPTDLFLGADGTRYWSITVRNTSDSLSRGFGIYDMNSTYRMFITSVGNIGIGTSAPAYRLDVINNARIASIVMEVNDEINRYGGTLYLLHRGTVAGSAGNTGNVAMVCNGGNVGVGIPSPNYKLDVKGTFNSSNYQVGGSLELKTDDTACQTTVFGSNSSGYRMRIVRQATSTNLNTLDSPTLVLSSFDTHAYIALSYHSDSVWVGGGSSNKWNWRSKLVTSTNYGSYLGYIGTTAVLKSSAAQALTGITNATMSGVTTTNTLIISNTSATGHLIFSRSSYNYITAPTNGSIGFCVNGKAAGAGAHCEMVISDGAVFPGTTNVTSLGDASHRWSDIYSALGNFSSTIQANRYHLKYAGTTGIYADLLINIRGTACTTEGTAGTTGITYLLLGNSTAVSATAGSGADNALGILRIYGSSSGHTNIRCGTNNGSSYTLYLPGDNGLFVYHTNDTAVGNATTPVYVTAGGKITACTSYTSALDGRYVNVAGDTMTGNLAMSTGAGIHLWDDSATASHRLTLYCASDIGRIYNYNGSAYGAMYIGYNGTNAIVVTSELKVGIGTGSPSYPLHVAGDSCTTGWFRAGSGFYVEGKGVYYMSNNASGLGLIYLTSNEFNWSASTTTLYFNYRASANGKTVTLYIWNAGSSTTYANHTTGKIDAKSHVLTTNNFGINSTAGGGRGISLYGGSDFVDIYGIAFNQTPNWGTHGYVTGDWATYFTMSNTENRGWIFRTNDGTRRLSINAQGHLYANGLVNADRFNSRVATGTLPYACASTTLNTNLNADLLDGYHASSLVKFYLSPMTSNAPADSAKSWFINTMPSSSGAIVYNVPGSEKTIIAGKSSGPFGHMLQLNYEDNYLRILRYLNGNWKTTDWEKIAAGYADSAGNADTLDGKHLKDLNVLYNFTFNCESLSTSNFYPLFFSVSDHPLHCKILSNDRSVNHAYNQNTIEFKLSACGWSDTPVRLIVYNYGCYSNNEITIGSIGYGTHLGGVCVWVRGGSTYRVWSNRSCLLMTSNYTYGDEVYTIGTSYNGGTNTYVTTLFVPQSTISSGAYTNDLIKSSSSMYAAHFYENSDAKLKTNIQNINSSNNIPILKEFDWKKDGTHGYGLIALELEEMGYSELVNGEEDGSKTVNYSAALSLIVGKLQVKIKELEKEIENLKNKN